MLLDHNALRELNIVISTHVFISGPSQDLRDYLLSNKVNKLLFIGHPLFYDPALKESGYDYYENGVLSKSSWGKPVSIVGNLHYVKHFFLNLYYVLKFSGVWDVYFGFDNLNALSGIILKRLGKVKKSVYYVIDYNPHRFNNSILNFIYHKIDQLSARYCDETWNLSPRMIEGRKMYYNFEAPNQYVVPFGIWLNRVKILPIEKVARNQVIFVGHIIESKGIQNFLEAIPSIIKEIPDFNFVVVGKGPYLEVLQKKVHELGILEHVDFKGYVESVEDLLSQSACSVALYEKYEGKNLSYTYFADPAKLRSYMSCGLPVILTDVPYSAKEIQDKKCGIVISLDKQSIKDAVIHLLKDENVYLEYRNNAIDYVKDYDWNDIFEKNLGRLLAHL